MSGGVGCGNLLELCCELLQYTTKPFTACVMTGVTGSSKGSWMSIFMGIPACAPLLLLRK